MIMVIDVTDDKFEEVIVNSEVPAIVDFWAEWCGPCRMVSPIVKELSEEYGDKILVAKMDVDSNPNTAVKYGIRNIPTILFFKNGEVVDKQVGAVPKAVLASKLDALL
ncbi:MAG: thioredoxin [Chlorobi bacterium]|nr:thioredoxin [Chlorobiota bacterium]